MPAAATNRTSCSILVCALEVPISPAGPFPRRQSRAGPDDRPPREQERRRAERPVPLKACEASLRAGRLAPTKCMPFIWRCSCRCPAGRQVHAESGVSQPQSPLGGNVAGLRPRSPGDGINPGGTARLGWHGVFAAHSLVWGRDVREETVADFLQKVDADYLITGHIPCDARLRTAKAHRHVIVDSQGSPAGCCLVPANRPISPADLDGAVHLL